MESKLNYTLVGLFVIGLLASLIIIVMWLSGYNKNDQYEYYHVYMTESVSGLSIDSAVKYLGVDVGTVTQISLNLDNSQQVQLLLQIQQGVPVKTDTTATLKFFGVTGLAFIELMGGKKESPLLKPNQAGEIPVINAAASTFSNIEKTLNDLASNSATVLEKVDQLLSTENLENVSEILLETKALISDFRSQKSQIASLIENGIVAEKNINDAFKKIGLAAESVAAITEKLAKDDAVAKALSEIELASQSVASMADSFKHNYGDNISDEVVQSLASFQQLLNQMNVLIVDLQQTVKSIEASPSDLFFKQSQPKLGPGEESRGGK